MSATETQNHPAVGDEYRVVGSTSEARLVVTKVANGKVSYRVNGVGRQRTFSLAGFLADVERVSA